MSLKTRFLLLILGTFFIPNIIIVTMVGFSFGGVRNIREFHTQLRTYHDLSEMVSGPVERGVLDNFLKDLPPKYSCTVLDSNSGSSYDILQNGRKLQAFFFSFTDGTDALLLAYFPVFDEYTMFRNTPFQILAPLSLLSVLTILSLGVIRSINVSLHRIEDATRKLSSGQYDIELPVKGNDSIASLSRSFNLMAKEVKEDNARRSRFFMGVSHDLKTPLASISGYADAILAGYAEDSKTLDKYAGIIKAKSSLLLDRINQLISFVQLETKDWKESFRQIQLQEFLVEFAEAASLDAEVSRRSLTTDIDVSTDRQVLMDPQLVRRALDNIIHNALRYSFKDSAVCFKAAEVPEGVQISVANKGEGIPEEDLSYVFEPFYRGSSARNEEGFGLGLANVASIIKSHGWKIAVTSVPYGETEFVVLIPRE